MQPRSLAAARVFNWPGHSPLFPLLLNVSCWCCCGATWPLAPVYSDSWRARESEGECFWRGRLKPERLLRHTPYLSWLFVTVNYVAVLLQKRHINMEREFRCRPLLCYFSLNTGLKDAAPPPAPLQLPSFLSVSLIALREKQKNKKEIRVIFFPLPSGPWKQNNVAVQEQKQQ